MNKKVLLTSAILLVALPLSTLVVVNAISRIQSDQISEQYSNVDKITFDGYVEPIKATGEPVAEEVTEDDTATTISTKVVKTEPSIAVEEVFNINTAVEKYNFTKISDNGYFKYQVLMPLVANIPSRFQESNYIQSFEFLNNKYSCMSNSLQMNYSIYLLTNAGWEGTLQDPQYKAINDNLSAIGC